MESSEKWTVGWCCYTEQGVVDSSGSMTVGADTYEQAVAKVTEMLRPGLVFKVTQVYRES